MAPKKRTKNPEEEPAAAAVVKTAPSSSRVTRSSSRLAANSKADLPAVVELPKSKRVKRAPKENGKAEEVENEGEEVEAAAEKLGEDEKGRTVVIEHCKQCQSFKKRAIEVQNGLENGVPGITVLLNPDKVLCRVRISYSETGRTPLILISKPEHKPHIVFAVSPRRGCFEVRSEDGEKFISLLDLKRPFTPMKELNMEEVISDIVSKING